MANKSVETDSENIISLLLVDTNRPIELEWKLFVTDENKVSNFTIDSLESNFLEETWNYNTRYYSSMAEANTYEMKDDVDSVFPQPAAVTLN